MPSVERGRWPFASEAESQGRSAGAWTERMTEKQRAEEQAGPGTRARYLLGLEAGINCTCCIALECNALDAEASGPLHKVTVAAIEHRMPTAIARPGWFLMAPTLPSKYVENAWVR